MKNRLIINTYTDNNRRKLFLSPYISFNYNLHNNQVVLLNNLFGHSMKFVVKKETIIELLTLLQQGIEEQYLKEYLSAKHINVSIEQLLFTCIIE